MIITLIIQYTISWLNDKQNCLNMLKKNLGVLSERLNFYYIFEYFKYHEVFFGHIPNIIL